MSTPKTDKTAAKTVVPCASCFVVEKGREATESLADYVRRIRNEKNLSLVDVSVRSRGAIGRTHINRIENGLTTNPSPRKLRALAQGLGVPEEELFAVARGRVPANKDDADELKLLIHFRELSDQRKEDLLAIAQSLKREHLVGGPSPGRQSKRSKGRAAEKEFDNAEEAFAERIAERIVHRVMEMIAASEHQKEDGDAKHHAAA